mgnify:CR=1 FL=1
MEMIDAAELIERCSEVQAMSGRIAPKQSGRRLPTRRTRSDRIRYRHGGGGRKKGM